MRPAAVAVAPYPDVVVELLVAKGGPTDVFVVEPPAFGLAHMAHVREFCLAFFRGFRHNWREIRKVFISTMYILPGTDMRNVYGPGVTPCDNFYAIFVCLYCALGEYRTLY